MWRKPRRLKRWADPVISPDRKSLWVRIETESGLSGDIDIPLSEIGGMVAFLASIANYPVSEPGDLNALLSPPASQAPAPIPILGARLTAGRDASEKILTLQLAGFDLAFSLDGEKAAEFGAEVRKSGRPA